MNVLAIDASTYTASVAVLRDGTVRAGGRVTMRGVTEERLLPAVAEALEGAAMTPRDLGQIVCGGGPGSFTSLRIAASIAKGMATTLGAPLVAVPSLALVVAASPATRAAGTYVAALDALRGEHYVATCTVDEDGQVIAVGALERWPSSDLARRASGIGPLVGPGLPLPAEPDVAAIPRLRQLLTFLPPVDLAAWEPAYGRLAEAQVKWEAAHGRPLSAG